MVALDPATTLELVALYSRLGVVESFQNGDIGRYGYFLIVFYNA